MRAPATFPDEPEPERRLLIPMAGATTAGMWCSVNPVHDPAWGANGVCWCGAALMAYATSTTNMANLPGSPVWQLMQGAVW